MEAWIEINVYPVVVVVDTLVAPLVEAWIEMFFTQHRKLGYEVAPLVEAWIEIRYCYYNNIIHFVAPLVEAWIEIHQCYKNN